MILSVYSSDISIEDRESLTNYGIVGSCSNTQEAKIKARNWDSLELSEEHINYDYLFKSIPVIVEFKKSQ